MTFNFVKHIYILYIYIYNNSPSRKDACASHSMIDPHCSQCNGNAAVVYFGVQLFHETLENIINKRREGKPFF